MIGHVLAVFIRTEGIGKQAFPLIGRADIRGSRGKVATIAVIHTQHTSYTNTHTHTTHQLYTKHHATNKTHNLHATSVTQRNNTQTDTDTDTQKQTQRQKDGHTDGQTDKHKTSNSKKKRNGKKRQGMNQLELGFSTQYNKNNQKKCNVAFTKGKRSWSKFLGRPRTLPLTL